MKRSLLALALLVTMAMPALAQGGRHGGMMKLLDEPPLAAAKELGRSLVTWARAEVLPEAQAWKTQLDNSLAPQDLAKLNELRARAAQLQARKAALKGAMREAWKSEDDDARARVRTEMKELRAERETILQELKPIAERSRPALEAIAQTAMPRVKEWIAEARTIGETWWEQHKSSVSPQAAMAIGRLMKHRGDLFQLVEPKLRSKAAAARFMLWNGEDVTRQFEGMMERGEIEDPQELDFD